MELTGIAASPGIAEGSAYIYRNPDLTITEKKVDDIPGEIDRLRSSASSAVKELAFLKESVRKRLGDEFAHIFRSQQTIAEDDSIIVEIEDRIREENSNAEAALRHIFEAYIVLFA